jgi:hypothetical protein
MLADRKLKALVCQTMAAGPDISANLVTDEIVAGYLDEFDFREVRRAPSGGGGYYDILFVRDSVE